jgi:hypothetical protein
MYAPAHVSRYTFEVVLQFSSPYNLTTASCGATYTCLLGMGSKGVIQAGSATMLEPGGKLYSIQVCAAWMHSSSAVTQQSCLGSGLQDCHAEAHVQALVQQAEQHLRVVTQICPLPVVHTHLAGERAGRGDSVHGSEGGPLQHGIVPHVHQHSGRLHVTLGMLHTMQGCIRGCVITNATTSASHPQASGLDQQQHATCMPLSFMIVAADLLRVVEV